MSKLHSGLWIGVAVNPANGNSELVKLNLAVGDDGTVRGTVTDEERKRAEGKEHPPIEGRFSPYGTLHLRYTPDERRVALFDGRFQTPDENHGVIWGSLFLSDGNTTYNAAASFHFARELPQTPNGHVWGG
jgi:hypothetical protein